MVVRSVQLKVLVCTSFVHPCGDPTTGLLARMNGSVRSLIDFAHAQLHQEEPQGSRRLGRRSRPGDIEARFGRKHLDSDHLGVSYFRYGPAFRAPFGHRHREQEEAYVVVAGSGRMKLDDDIVESASGTSSGSRRTSCGRSRGDRTASR